MSPTTNTASYGSHELKSKVDSSETAAAGVRVGAEAGMPTQPLTSGVWEGDWERLPSSSPSRKFSWRSRTSFRSTTTTSPRSSRKRGHVAAALAAAFSAPNTWRAGTGARSTALCRLRRNITWLRSTGVSWRGRRRRIFRGTRGRSPTSDRQPTIWFHEVFQTGRQRRTSRMRWIDPEADGTLTSAPECVASATDCVRCATFLAFWRAPLVPETTQLLRAGGVKARSPRLEH